MRGSIFPKLYRLAVGERFGISALLYPLQQYLELGDYGFYRHGAFVKVGNLFDEAQVCVDSYWDMRTSDPLHDLLIHTVNGVRDMPQPFSYDTGESTCIQFIRFRWGHGMVVHFQERFSEQLALTAEVGSMIQHLIRENRWDPCYRLVWQRDVARKWFAARTQSPGGVVALCASDYQSDVPLECQALDLVPTLCENINGDHWWHKTFPITPAVNFVKYCKREENFCASERHDGIDAFMDLDAEDPFFQIDNSSY